MSTLFRFVCTACLAFLLLTFAAMLVYPGGSHAAPNAVGYSFSTNFFSDLGRAQAQNGQSNHFSQTLFVAAMLLAGCTLALFFVTFGFFFRENVGQKILGLLGTSLGVAAGACFVAIGLTPADVFGPIHFVFVLWAFRCFFAATVFFAATMLLSHSYPRRYALVFGGFTALLAGYIALLTRGPSLDTSDGVLIQAVGQKIIVYAAIGVVWLQSRGAAKFSALHPNFAKLPGKDLPQ